MNKDKQIEFQRYDNRARSQLTDGITTTVALGSATIPPILRTPYICYERLIQENILRGHDVLEIGSGTGLHTYILVTTGARVTASDISSNSLEVIKKKLGEKIMTCVADMELLPFDANSFDVVVSAGSLSYGAAVRVDAEIRRVLRPGGMFICVDSLHHNPIYIFNRWINYLRGERTNSTLINMPTTTRIDSYKKYFGSSEVYYYGSLSWLMPVLAFLIGQPRTAKFSDLIDSIFKVRRSAFKFVMIAKGRL